MPGLAPGGGELSMGVGVPAPREPCLSDAEQFPSIVKTSYHNVQADGGC
jgi:hypothetical protein